ncbi:hypothetical protein Pfo_021890 [Paulownia fortunei]|nr:hypothetical protein Pfo_021890 [Paulownia fortunei]
MEKIRCPCKKCNNVYYQNRDDVEADLFEYGIVKHYVTWVLHGEELDKSDDEDFDFDEEEKDDQLELDKVNKSDTQEYQNDYVDMQMPKWESEKFMRLLRDADKELYPGCENFTKISFIITLMYLKIVSRWSNKSFSMLLEVLKKALPNGEALPCSYYEAEKIIQDLGLDYEKIHACVKDCVLFRKEHEKEEKCRKCSTPRYKLTKVDNDTNGEKKHKKIPQKVLHYFPLKPRKKRTDDGVLRHPVDAKEWKEFNKMHESFAQDPRNVRLGLATDGFNPFSNMNLSYSTWPVILLPYNLPPWKCLKAYFFIMSMLIPGQTSPGNAIYVFLELLIDELKDLWDHGVETYDASTSTKFSLRAKKYSIFFRLPYWKTLRLRHNLDVMYIEKNVCDNILGILLDIDGKIKDNHQLHLKLDGNSYLVPPACYTLYMTEKMKLCAFLASVKYPNAYAASLSKRVNTTDCRLTVLKTHDCHTILHQLLPISVHGLLNNNVCEALHEISKFFKQLCSKALNRVDLEYLEDQITLTLCKLERIFPPAFFDIMVHLPIHLAQEVILGGTIQYQWMYPIEMYLFKLKQYVNNKVFPEESMVEGYIVEDLTFCSIEDLLHLSYGPDKRVTHYEACVVNGLRFHIKQPYYGVLINISQLDYMGNHQVVVFKYDWYKGKSIKKVKFSCTSINISKPWKTNESYVLASQAQHVFYVNDIKLGNDWKVVIENKDDECIMIDGSYQQNEDFVE